METIVIGTFADREKAEESFNEKINKELNGDTNTNTYEIIENHKGYFLAEDTDGVTDFYELQIIESEIEI